MDDRIADLIRRLKAVDAELQLMIALLKASPDSLARFRECLALLDAEMAERIRARSEASRGLEAIILGAEAIMAGAIERTGRS